VTEDIIAKMNGGPNQATRACKGPQFNGSIEDTLRKLALAGACGMVTFVLYEDGSCAFKPVGKVTAGLCKVIGEWGINNLANYIEQMEQKMLETQIAAARRN